MVFFTCNKCGESLKKKDVEKHCNTRCRGAPYLTCVDCLKDFREDFVKHTLCVSEDDRYSAMGLKGLQTKQKSKQQIWVETVQDCVSRAIDGGVPGLTPSIRDLLLYLQDQPTLPDKQKTFTNFVKNARRTEPFQNIDFVWKVLEKARNDMQAQLKAEREAAEAAKRQAKEQQKKERKEDSSSSSSDDSDDSDDEEKEKSTKNGAVKDKTKNDKHQSEEDETVAAMNGKKDKKKKKRMVSESDSVTNGSSEFVKTKKSKKNPESDAGENTGNLNNAMNACHLDTETTSDQKLSKKEKKEKKKRGKYEAELKEMETANDGETAEDCDQPAEEVTEVTESKKEKKKKGKKNSDTTAVEEPTDTNTGERKKKDKKNKKRLLSGTEEAVEHVVSEKSEKKKVKNIKSDHCQLNADLNMEEMDSVKFTWDAAIMQVLESAGEISLKRLSKKVVNEYLMSLGANSHIDEMKIMSKFHKRLEKMHNVLVLKDKVRLRTSSD